MERLSKLTELRKEKKLTRKELASRSGLSYDAITSLELGRVNPYHIHVETLVKLASGFKMSTSKLVKYLGF